MFKSPVSIRHKITLGYYLGLLFVLAFAVLTYVNLWRVERKVAFSEVVSDFFEMTLEMRRFEKNYFLFEKEEDYIENRRYLDNALVVLAKYPEGFEDVSPEVNAAGISTEYRSYARLMELAHNHISRSSAGDPKGYAVRKESLEGQARKKGKEITGIAEQISRQERENIRALLGFSRTMLWISLGILFVVGILIGHTLARVVVRPMKLLERYTEKVSRGEYVKYEGGYQEKEVDSLLKAFNRMTTELEARQGQLVRSEKLASLGTLLSGVAHELNNPLSNISSSAQILSEEIEDPDVDYKKELIGQIEQQSDKARDIVKSLLEFSREREFKKERLGLMQLLKDTKMLLRGQLPSMVQVQLSVPEELEITADKQRIQQVFLNLLTNALDAVTQEGHVEVAARETVGLTGERVVEIEVKDDGAGIEPDMLKNIFDPFFTTKDVGRGSGLGLFIVYDIIERHDGKVSVESEPGVGTTFTITLPQGNEEANGAHPHAEG